MDYENIYYTCNFPKKDIPLGKYNARNYRAEGASDDAHNVKSDNPDLLKKKIAINRIAKHIIDQNILTSKDYIVPAPQHTGRAEYTLDIAKIISKETGCKIADVLGCKPRDTLYNLKKKHGAKSIEDSGLYLLTKKFPKYNVWFLDNVTATGTTFNDARKLIPHLKPLIYSVSPRLKIKMKNRKTYFIRENRTYVGDEVKEVVDWLISSPYNSWKEKDREYLMNCDSEKLYKYENDTFDLECDDRSFYESNNNRSKNMNFKRIYESTHQGVNLFWKNKVRLTLSDLEKAVNKVKSYAENEWDGYYPTPRVYLSFIDSGAHNDLFFGVKGCDAYIYNSNAPDNLVGVELYFNEKKVGISELKGILNNLQSEIDDGYDEFYLDLERVEGNKLFFTKGYEERD